MLPSFEFYRTPIVRFGPGRFADIPAEAETVCHGPQKGNLLLVIGRSLRRIPGRLSHLLAQLKDRSLDHFVFDMSGEPTPETIDSATEVYRNRNITLVIGIGGGSVMDAGKAISAMLPCEGSVADYLEGVGGKKHSGRKVPFIAVPTTSGTGSEATKNSVLSRVGPKGFKKSLRHERFIPDLAIIDPELTLTCPRSITAACGMDALSQLLESYLSTNASPITDSLAVDAIKRVANNLEAACGEGSNDVNVRSQMAYAATISGITLANAGLGVVHGLAGPIGGLFPIPHGVVCGGLLGPAMEITLQSLKNQPGMNSVALSRLAIAGTLFNDCSLNDIDGCCEALIESLYKLADKLQIPQLSDYGITRADLDRIVDKSGQKNHPVVLGKEEIKQILMKCVDR